MTPKRSKVVVTDFLSEPLDIERQYLGDLADVSAANAKVEADLVGKVEDADILFVYHLVPVKAATLDRLTRCKLIVRGGVGCDNIDLPAARARGIDVANVPDYGTEDVADSAIGMALSLTRGIHRLNQRLQRGLGPWSHTPVAPVGRLRGRTFGIIGLGRIGTACALRAKALGMNVLFYDPYVRDGTDKSIGVKRAESLEELLSQCLVVSAHCPLTPETHHILNEQTIGLMPKGSYIVNTSRGGVVDVMAVLKALEKGHLNGAGIDVLEKEPPEMDHPLLVAWKNPEHPAHDRLILNPHAAFYSEEGLMDMRAKGLENCRRVLLGQTPRNIVN